MDCDKDKDKVYVNLNIQYHLDEGFSSRAAADYFLIDPIVNRAGNYQVSVTDLQVDTKSIPLFICEYKTERNESVAPAWSMQAQGPNNFITMNYWVQVIDNFQKQNPVYLRKPVVIPQLPLKKTYNDLYRYANDNTNAYIYSHQEFIDMVNAAIDDALPAQYRRSCACGYVIRNGRLVFLIQNAELYRRLAGYHPRRLQILFSPSLFQYLGVGFPTMTETSYWEYSYIVHLQEKSETSYQYYSLVQSVSNLQSWHACKAIIVYSQNMPIAEEVFPTASVGAELTHYENLPMSVSYKYNTKELGMKVLYVHYIDYNKVKSLVNGITVHNSCVDNGIRIDMEKSLPLQKVDIKIGWIDNYGNLFPLKLTYGSTCNVRLCFTRRNVVEHYDYTKVNDGVQHLPYLITAESDSEYDVDNDYDEDNGSYVVVEDDDDMEDETKEGLYNLEPKKLEMITTADDILPNPDADDDFEVVEIDPMNVTPIINKYEEEEDVLPEVINEVVASPKLEPEEEKEVEPAQGKEDFYKKQQELIKQILDFNNFLN